jgi:hypothetical protein
MMNSWNISCGNFSRSSRKGIPVTGATKLLGIVAARNVMISVKLRLFPRYQAVKGTKIKITKVPRLGKG